jgi:pyridoxal phosphate enzyme (YggS family)
MSLPDEPARIAGRLSEIRGRMAKAAAESGRPAEAVTLVAVSKTQPIARIEAALAAGQRTFGENRVQEAAGRWPTLCERHAGIELHLVGPLQTNKVRDAVALFDCIQSVDRAKLARALAAEMQRSGRRTPCFVQVNTGEEPQKAGVAPLEADGLIALCRDELQLPLAGLMCIPPFDDSPAPHFALLAQIARRNGLRSLSMGMSEDFETAIHLGATHVRIGTAIFGERTATGLG